MARAPFLYWPVVCLGLLAAGPATAQTDPAEIDAVLADIVDTHDDIQWTLPVRTEGPPLPVQDAPVPPEPLQEPLPEQTTEPQPGWAERLTRVIAALLAGWAYLVLWAAVCLGGLLIAYMLWRERPGSLDRAHANEGFADLAPLDLTPDRITFRAAAELANAGRHAEAIHTLLLVCLRELRRKMDLSTALTAREIARDRRLAEAARAELATVSAAVERSLFAGRLVSAADYQDCLSHSRQFMTALDGSGDRGEP